MAKFKPLTLDLIEEGRLKGDLDEQMEAIQHSLCAYVEEHGDAAEGSVATLTLKVKIRCESVADKLFSVVGKIDKQVPTRPSRSTVAIKDVTDDGVFALFARASGSSDGNPKQLKLATDDGRAIDPATGEAKPKSKSA